MPAHEAIESARLAELRYTSDARPGIRRTRAGRHWSYRGVDGSLVRDEATLARIRKLAVPPAWTDVWISPDASGHLQATGRDARGRKQYRYHVRWRQVRDANKYGRLIEFAEALAAIRERVDADLARPGLPREKVLAAVVRLLESTLIRVGNEEYARANDSYGLTTLRTRHVNVNGNELRFRFRGKSGKEHLIGLRDRRLAAVVRRCQELPGEDLFQYADEAGAPQSISSSDVNEYLREISGSDFTAKDFRTWAGTVLMAMALATAGAPESARQAKHVVARAVESVAAELRNTPAVCRACYVHPAIVESYEDGSLRRAFGRTRGNGAGALAPEERAVLGLLRRHGAA